jgi:hypothetical protein
MKLYTHKHSMGNNTSNITTKRTSSKCARMPKKLLTDIQFFSAKNGSQHVELPKTSVHDEKVPVYKELPKTDKGCLEQVVDSWIKMLSVNKKDKKGDDDYMLTLKMKKLLENTKKNMDEYFNADGDLTDEHEKELDSFLSLLNVTPDSTKGGENNAITGERNARYYKFWLFIPFLMSMMFFLYRLNEFSAALASIQDRYDIDIWSIVKIITNPRSEHLSKLSDIFSLIAKLAKNAAADAEFSCGQQGWWKRALNLVVDRNFYTQCEMMEMNNSLQLIQSRIGLLVQTGDGIMTSGISLLAVTVGTTVKYIKDRRRNSSPTLTIENGEETSSSGGKRKNKSRGGKYRKNKSRKNKSRKN